MECPVHSMARSWPDALAYTGLEGAFTYRELDRAMSARSRWLESKGVQRGDMIAVQAPNGWDLITLVLGTIRSGRQICLLSMRQPSATARRQVERSGARIAFLASEGQPIPPLGLLPSTASEDEWDLKEEATILYTSGTTGEGRAVVHSAGAHVYSALGSNENISLAPGDKWLITLPLFHVGGLGIVFRCILAGATVVNRTSGVLNQDLEGVTHASLVATQLMRLLKDDVGIPGTLKAVLLGGSAIPADALRGAKERGVPIHTSYGLTEMASQVTATAPGAGPAELGTSGRLLSHRLLSIAADGEILVSGATLFSGYLERGRVMPPVPADGWFRTGDTGHLVDGLLVVDGRRDNMFISGGENIQPEAIEAAILQMPGIEQAVVVPIEDAEFGFRPVVFVDAIHVPQPEELAEHLSGTLPRFMHPTACLRWPDIAKDSLKPPRKAMAEIALRLLQH
jgi:o-succinylbenzoate---CoA ligase